MFMATFTKHNLSHMRCHVDLCGTIPGSGPCCCDFHAARASLPPDSRRRRVGLFSERSYAGCGLSPTAWQGTQQQQPMV